MPQGATVLQGTGPSPWSEKYQADRLPSIRSPQPFKKINSGAIFPNSLKTSAFLPEKVLTP